MTKVVCVNVERALRIRRPVSSSGAMVCEAHRLISYPISTKLKPRKTAFQFGLYVSAGGSPSRPKPGKTHPQLGRYVLEGSPRLFYRGTNLRRPVPNSGIDISANSKAGSRSRIESQRTQFSLYSWGSISKAQTEDEMGAVFGCLRVLGSFK